MLKIGMRLRRDAGDSLTHGRFGFVNGSDDRDFQRRLATTGTLSFVYTKPATHGT